MDKIKRQQLVDNGWIETTAEEFLGLEEDSLYNRHLELVDKKLLGNITETELVELCILRGILMTINKPDQTVEFRLIY